ncbi:hypothetical protein EXIGLDRAFT_831088 [Exidia glandulosa HHB12029]|uniref:Smr domain-containing protein n=1 Tax=Exidia glandulosa HHB12029 TaxID=1314781 RepID=A0A165N071_EXIGL|nr:hypothetical protein EXIGLDRAFT_831088 [Exidia glandulosa HHB12029]
MPHVTVEDLATKYAGLDSSLIAALLGDHDVDDLAADALALAELESQLSALHLDFQLNHQDCSSASEPAYSTDRDFESCSEFTTPDLSETSSTSSPQPDVMLKFLETAFPHLPVDALERKLLACADIQTAVEQILSEEYIRELEERGMGDEEGGSMPPPPPPAWVEVLPRSQRKKKPKGRTIVLSDVRQQSLSRSPSVASTSSLTPTPTGLVRAAMDESPWVRLDSIAMRLAELLPPTSPAAFLSPFHSPEHASPAAALRSALIAIAVKARLPVPSSDIVRFLLETYPSEVPLGDDAEAEVEDVALKDDAVVCLRAAQGRVDDAMDVLSILRDLARTPQFATIHAPPVVPLTSRPTIPLKARPPPVRSQTAPIGPPVLPASGPSRLRPPVNEWQVVGKKRKPPPVQPAHADFIPAYRVGVPGARKQQRQPTQYASDESADEVEYLRREARAFQAERNEALRLAMRHWRSGNSRNLGGEVALYYAERSRELYDAATKHSLDAARISVMQKRRRTGASDEIDLHGLSISEAYAVVKEILNESPPNPDRPLKIITGLGKHSAEYKSVLQPALRSRLTEEGWTVALWDAGLTVRGRGTFSALR